MSQASAEQPTSEQSGRRTGAEPDPVRDGALRNEGAPARTVRTVHVAVYPGWADWEVGHLMARVNDHSWQRVPGSLQIRTVGENLAPVLTMGGLRITPDLTADQVTPAGSAMLVLPGTGGWERGAGIPWAASLAERFLAEGTPVAAICGATAGLARAGLLDDRAHTSAAPEYLKATGYTGSALYRDEDVVVDRGLITAGPVHGLPFARAALAELGAFRPEILEAWYRVFTENDLQAYGVLAAAAA
jgi:putative intracellular protease/amidase